MVAPQLHSSIVGIHLDQKGVLMSQGNHRPHSKTEGRSNRTYSHSNSKSNLIPYSEDNEEGKMTKTIEKQTSKVSSVVYLALAAGSMALSLAIAVKAQRKELANFVGLWAPTFLILGLYNKIVKIQGSDFSHQIG
jgi:hypothetical protein